MQPTIQTLKNDRLWELMENRNDRKAVAARLQANVPAELKALHQWVRWEVKYSNEKYTKVPYQCDTIEKASSTDPKTWSDFKLALYCYQNKLSGAGIGFVLSPDDPYVGFDFDDCMDPNTGRIEASTLAMVHKLGGYAEVSPSGTGVRVIVRGSLPPGRRKHTQRKIEVYDQARFLTITGQVLDGVDVSAPIPDRKTELMQIYEELFAPVKQTAQAPSIHTNGTSKGDDELLQVMFRAKNGAAIQALYNGDTTAQRGDLSAADFALCSHLAFYTQDANQIDRMFRSSGLYRDKWDSRRGNTTYGAETIAKVLRAPGAHTYQSTNGTSEREVIFDTPAQVVPSVEASTPGAPAIPVYTRKQFNDLPPIEWMVEGLFAAKDCIMVYGPSGAGKTFVMLDLAAACVAGQDVAGTFAVKRPMKVWYCSREGQGGMGARLNAACEKYNLPDDAALYYTPITPQLFQNEAGNPQAAKWFIQRWQQMNLGQLDLLIIDTYWTATDGMDENSASDARVVARTLDEIKCSLGCAVMLSHHANKGGIVERGSGALRAIMDSIVRVNKENNRHTLECEKQKEGEEWQALGFELHTSFEDVRSCYVEWAAPSKAPAPDTQSQIVDLLQSDLRLWGASEIASTLGTCTRQNVAQQLEKLAKEGKVIPQGKPAKYKAATQAAK